MHNLLRVFLITSLLQHLLEADRPARPRICFIPSSSAFTFFHYSGGSLSSVSVTASVSIIRLREKWPARRGLEFEVDEHEIDPGRDAVAIEKSPKSVISGLFPKLAHGFDGVRTL